MFVGSDALALAPFTDEVSYLEDGDWAVLTREGRRHSRPERQRGAASASTARWPRRSWSTRATTAISWRRRSTSSRRSSATRWRASSICRPARVEPPKLPFDFAKLSRLAISACGTAFYAGLVAKYWFERWAQLPGRRRYRLGVPLPRGRLASQAAPLSSSRSPARRPTRSPRCGIAASRARALLSIVNVREILHRARIRCRCCRRSPGPRSASPRPRPSPASSPCLPASPSPPAGRAGMIDAALEAELVQALAEVPRHMATVLRDEQPYETLAHAFARRATCSISAAARAIRSRSRAR